MPITENEEFFAEQYDFMEIYRENYNPDYDYYAECYYYSRIIQYIYKINKNHFDELYKTFTAEGRYKKFAGKNIENDEFMNDNITFFMNELYIEKLSQEPVETNKLFDNILIDIKSKDKHREYFKEHIEKKIIVRLVI
jgi:hypothetical protein